jgi:hypothetical protein
MVSGLLFTAKIKPVVNTKLRNYYPKVKLKCQFSGGQPDKIVRDCFACGSAFPVWGTTIKATVVALFID